jgi:hypothetical protein
MLKRRGRLLDILAWTDHPYIFDHFNIGRNVARHDAAWAALAPPTVLRPAGVNRAPVLGRCSPPSQPETTGPLCDTGRIMARRRGRLDRGEQSAAVTAGLRHACSRHNGRLRTRQHGPSQVDARSATSTQRLSGTEDGSPASSSTGSGSSGAPPRVGTED